MRSVEEGVGAVVICSCRAVSDRAIREAIAQGARSVDAVSAACDVANDCGLCWSELDKLVAETCGDRVHV
jgi:bacterioferritin-associated ferredoxin